MLFVFAANIFISFLQVFHAECHPNTEVFVLVNQLTYVICDHIDIVLTSPY